MANAWAIRADGSSAHEQSYELGKFTGSRAPKVRVGDIALIFHRTRGEVQFTAEGIVTKVFASRSNNEQTEYHAEVEIHTVFEVPRTLDDLRFSLPRIYRLKGPEIHFRRRYLRLYRGEDEVIRTGELHHSRTALGILAEALPSRDRWSIVADFLGADGKPPEGATHEYLLQQVLLVVRRDYVETARLLTSLGDEVHALVKAEIEIVPLPPQVDPDGAQQGPGLWEDYRYTGDEPTSLQGALIECETGPALDIFQLLEPAAKVVAGFDVVGRSPFEELAQQTSESTFNSKAFPLRTWEVLRIMQVPS